MPKYTFRQRLMTQRQTDNWWWNTRTRRRRRWWWWWWCLWCCRWQKAMHSLSVMHNLPRFLPLSYVIKFLGNYYSSHEDFLPSNLLVFLPENLTKACFWYEKKRQQCKAMKNMRPARKAVHSSTGTTEYKWCQSFLLLCLCFNWIWCWYFSLRSSLVHEMSQSQSQSQNRKNPYMPLSIMHNNWHSGSQEEELRNERQQSSFFSLFLTFLSLSFSSLFHENSSEKNLLWNH